MCSANKNFKFLNLRLNTAHHLSATPASITLHVVCIVVDQWQYDCLSSGQTSITVNCPAIYQVQFRQSMIYQLSASCPSNVDSTAVNGACQSTNQSIAFPTCAVNVSACSYSFTAPSSSATCSGSYVVATKYRCLPGKFFSCIMLAYKQN